MYSVRLRSGARHGETPRIGGNPKNQPISELDIFSKRQALSGAVVVNSNMSRGKYLAREGPGSRPGKSRLPLIKSVCYPMQARSVFGLCHSLSGCHSLEPVFRREQRTARSNGKRNRTVALSFTKNIYVH